MICLPSIIDRRPSLAWLGLLLLGSLLMGSGCLAGEPESGEGIYARFDQEYLQTHGFPYMLNQSYWSPANGEGEWGLLYDEGGVPYGPNSLYHFKSRQDHPDLAVTDSTITGRWFAINRHGGLTEEMFGRWLELMDLAWMEYVEVFDYRPQHRVQVYAPDKLYEYKATGPSVPGHF